jgi:hypothetical protein
MGQCLKRYKPKHHVLEKVSIKDQPSKANSSRYLSNVLDESIKLEQITESSKILREVYDQDKIETTQDFPEKLEDTQVLAEKISRELNIEKPIELNKMCLENVSINESNLKGKTRRFSAPSSLSSTKSRRVNVKKHSLNFSDDNKYMQKLQSDVNARLSSRKKLSQIK